MPKRTPILLAVFCGGLYWGLAQTPDIATPPSHAPWDRLLQEYVDPGGTVDYKGFSRNRAQLEAYISGLEAAPPGDAWPREEKLAYYINLYNAATVRLILEHFPVSSIRDIPDPWGQPLLTVGGKKLSLDDIEHRILRKMEEPRIHFALNCASLSCPVLQPFAFTSKGLETQLEKAARDFINDPVRNRIAGGDARVSRLFKWYRDDFAAPAGDLRSYLNRYLDIPLPENAKIRFLPYDWSLNRP